MTRVRILLAIAAITTAGALPAAAHPATFVNGVENIVFAPVDAVLAPKIAVDTMRTNLENHEMSTFGRGATMAIGVPWVTILQTFVAGARIVSGVVEMTTGLALTPVTHVLDIDEIQLFDASGASPMVNREGVFDVVFGAHYISSH